MRWAAAGGCVAAHIIAGRKVSERTMEPFSMVGKNWISPAHAGKKPGRCREIIAGTGQMTARSSRLERKNLHGVVN